MAFVHGLWLLPSSWDRWVTLFEEAGFTAVTPGWPDDPETVEEAKANPEVFAHKSVGQIADYVDGIVSRLDKKPAVIGHSFGGLLAQILAGRGLASVTVAIDPAPFRGVLPLPISALRSASPVLKNPANRNKAVPLTYEQFRYSFANAVDEDEAKELFETYAVPGSGVPLFQAASANLNPWTEAKVDTKNPERGPLLIIVGDEDNTVPPSIAKAAYKQQQHNEGVTEYPGDSGPRPRARDRQRLARRRRRRARLRPAVRLDESHLTRLHGASARIGRSGARAAGPVRDGRLPGALRRADAASPARRVELHDPGRGRRAGVVDLGGVPRAAERDRHRRHPLRDQVVEARHGLDRRRRSTRSSTGSRRAPST